MFYRIIISISIILTIFLSTNLAQEKFVTFSPDDESFSVKMPAKPLNYSSNFGQRDDKRIYKFQKNDRYYFINCDKKLEYSGYKYLVEFLEENIVKILDNKNIRNDGEYLKIFDTEGYYHTILTVNRSDRFYVFHTISREENDELFESFFDSIKFTPITKEEKANVEKLAQKQNQLTKLKVNKDYKSPGDFEPVEETQKTEVVRTDKNGQTNGLQIESISKPGYTRIAREYYIEGGVRLKVDFLSNGKTGQITPTETLPFGLTTLAVKAARKIKFQPARLNGNPFNVRKTVAYNFTIY